MTRRFPSAGASLAALVVAVGLNGCVSVFPKSDPAQLYTFGRGGAGGVANAEAAPVERVGVLLAGVGFPRAAQGDAILTTTGAEAAYIAESRWVAPASVLFREAVERRFAERAVRARLAVRGDLGRTSLILRLDVREFEAQYAAPGAIPEASVAVQARLARADGSTLDERVFQVRHSAGDNRVSSIVAGLDRATSEVVDGIVAWADAAAAASPR